MDQVWEVEAVETFVVDSGAGKNWVFVRVETRDGIHGWGECYTYPGRELAIDAVVRQLGRYLVGRGAAEIRPFCRFAFLDFAGKRGSMEFYCALSGIEQALWDIVGKGCDQPVYTLLGGAFTTSFRVYANGWSYAHGWVRKGIDDVVASAGRLVDQGFDALKFDPFPGPWRPHLSRAEERSAVDCVRSVRDAVGDDVDLLVEAHRRLSPETAIRIARQIEGVNPFWYEEPVVATDLAGLIRVRDATTLPLVTGEALYGTAAFADIVAANAVDILNPDVSACGGIAELRDISSLAETRAMSIAPHNYNSTTVALASTLHASAGMSNFLITEYFIDASTRAAELAVEPLNVDRGVVALSAAPGLGMELDVDVMRQYPYREYPLRSF